MQDLNYELKQLCARNRDGSFATQANRERILTLIANQLREMGFVNMHVQSLKPKHVEKLVRALAGGRVERRHAQEPHGDPALVGREDRQAQRRRQEQRRRTAFPIGATSPTSAKPAQLTSGDLAQVTDPYTRMSLRLQATFGLRREESLKIRPGGRTAATPWCSRTVGPKAVAPARSRSAMPSNAKSWTRRSALPARAV